MTSSDSGPARLSPIDEEKRLAVLADYGAADLMDDPRLSAITGFAAALCGTPIALVSLVERERQWFPARCGLDALETPRDTSFCAYAMVQPGIMLVADAREDDRFRDNPLVTGAPGIRFYAGVPLLAEDDVPLGALCVIDTVPRAALTPLQAQGLAMLGQSVTTLLAARRAERGHRQTEARVRIERDEQEQRFRVLADTMPQMVWSTRPDGYHDYYNARWYEFTGVPEGSTDGEAWNGMFHPDDRERAWTHWRHSLASGDPYEIEYRLRDREGRYRWVLGRALPIRDGEGEITRWFGTCTDIHDQKLAMEEREIVSHELSHRIKNIFAIIGGLIGLTIREHPDLKAVANELRERVMALGRAHDFVRPHSEASRPSGVQTSLHNLLFELLSPYQSTGQTRVVISGDDPDIDDRSATPLALLFHELATNAAKYGALSSDTGCIRIDVCCADDRAVIIWSESGGPAPAKIGPDGFGSRLIALSVERQLGGKVEREWRPEGLAITVRLPLAAIRRAQSV